MAEVGIFIDQQKDDVFDKSFDAAAEQAVIAVEVFPGKDKNGFDTMLGEACEHHFVKMGTLLHMLCVFRRKVWTHPIKENLITYIIMLIAEPLVRKRFPIRFQERTQPVYKGDGLNRLNGSLNVLCAKTAGVFSVNTVFNQRFVNEGDFAEQRCTDSNPAVVEIMEGDWGDFVIEFLRKCHVAAGNACGFQQQLGELLVRQGREINAIMRPEVVSQDISVCIHNVSIAVYKIAAVLKMWKEGFDFVVHPYIVLIAGKNDISRTFAQTVGKVA